MVPPSVVPGSAPAAVFSADRALIDLRTIAMRPHPTASTDIMRVHHYLEGRLHSLGVEPQERTYLIDPKGFATLRGWNPKASPASEIVDLVGVLPGRDRSKPAVALMAHTDTVWGSAGGADDSIGVSSILEILRAIRARGTPARDIVVLLTDGEEVGLSGARAFWPSDGLANHVGVVINLESRGAGGRAAMFETGNADGAMIDLFKRSVRRPVANSMAVLAYRLMPNDTDFTPAREKGLPGFNFAVLGRAAYYHSPRATADRLDPRSLQDMGDQALDLTAALAAAPTLPGAARDATFFDVAGHRVLSYGSGTGWLILLVATAALVGACAGLSRAGLFDTRDIGRGLIAFLWLASHGLLLLIVLNLVSGSGGHPNYYDRLASLGRLEAQALFACGAALIAWLGLRRPARRGLANTPAILLAVLGWALGAPHSIIAVAGLIAALSAWFAPVDGMSRWSGWLAAIATLLLFAVLLQLMAPMAAWIVAWPVMIVGAAAALLAWNDPGFRKPWSWVIAAAPLAMVTAVLMPLAHLTFLGIGAPLPIAMLPFLLIVAMTVWPLARIEAASPVPLTTAGVLLVAALAIAVQVRTDPIAPTIPAYSLDK